MSKSVLVINTPERCIDCEIGQNYSNIIETWVCYWLERLH